MNSPTRSLAAGLAAAVLASAAAAVPLDISSGTVGFVGTPVSGAFTDTFTFTLPVAATLTGIVSSVVNGGQDVDFTSLVVTGPTGPSSFSQGSFDPFEIWTLSTPLLAAGGYTLTIVGSNSPAMGTYVGNLAVSAVPEPGTYAMWLAGLGAVGFLAVRNRRS